MGCGEDGRARTAGPPSRHMRRGVRTAARTPERPTPPLRGTHLEGEAEEHDEAAVVAVKVDALGDLAARDGEEDGAAAAVAGALEVRQRQRRLDDVLRLDEDCRREGDGRNDGGGKRREV